MNLASRLRQQQQKAGWNLKVIAAKTGLPYQQILRLFNGKSDNPTLHTLIRLAHGLNMSGDELLGLDLERNGREGHVT